MRRLYTYLRQVVHSIVLIEEKSTFKREFRLPLEEKKCMERLLLTDGSDNNDTTEARAVSIL